MKRYEDAIFDILRHGVGTNENHAPAPTAPPVQGASVVINGDVVFNGNVVFKIVQKPRS